MINKEIVQEVVKQTTAVSSSFLVGEHKSQIQLRFKEGFYDLLVFIEFKNIITIADLRVEREMKRRNFQ